MKKAAVLLTMLLLGILCAGCAQKEPPSPAPTAETAPEASLSDFPEGQRLRLTVHYGKEKGAISPDPDRPPFFYYEADSINYQNLTDIRIEIDGETMLLQDAMEQDLVTTDEIEAWARVDAKRGYCTMKYASRNGFASYTYHYGDFVITSTYDVYEAPDGKQYHDQFLSISNPANSVPVEMKAERIPRIKDGDGYVQNLDRENWGVTFEVLNASPSQLTLRCTQSGGQHLGQLQMDECSVSGITEPIETPYFLPDVTIQNDGVTEFTITWPESYGQLRAGDYEFKFSLIDSHGEIPELMRNYTDMQSYTIAFTIS